MALDNPIPFILQAAQQREQNRQQALQALSGIGDNIGGFADQFKKQQQEAQWQKTINEMMVNPQTSQQLKQFLPMIGQVGRQNPAVGGEMMASLGKNQQKSVYRPVSGMLSKAGHPMVINELTGDMKESALDAASTNKNYNTDLGKIKWEDFSPSEQQLSINLYNGNIRPGDIGYRERSKAVLGANMYGTQNNLPPYQSFGADVKKRSAEAFTSGKPAMNVLSLNTALGHLSSAYDAYQAIGNTDQKWLNRPLNALKRESSDPNIIKLGVTLNAVRGELATVFKGTGGTDQEIASWREFLTDDLTPSQINGALPQVDELLRSRLSALEQSRNQGMGNRPGSGPMLSPHAKEVSTKMQGIGKAAGNSGQLPPVGANFQGGKVLKVERVK